MAISLWKYKPFKFLTVGKLRVCGRNNSGRVTVYHRGGGSKKKLRIIDYKRYLWNINGIIVRLEYDPSRTAILALVSYSNGIVSYIIAQEGLCIGDKITASDFVDPFPGNASFLKNIPVGVKISCVEHYYGSGSTVARSAGSFVTIIKKLHVNIFSNNMVSFSKDAPSILVKMKSGELRKFDSMCTASFGVVSSFSFLFKKFRKAGYYRRKGWRPTVRGVAMNPIDHPHGGGQGKTSGGRPSVSRYGVITKGKPTFNKRRLSNKILKRRSFV